MKKNLFGRIKNYALSGILSVSLYTGYGCGPEEPVEPIPTVPLVEPLIHINYGVPKDRVREILPERNIEFAAEETRVERRMRDVGSEVLSGLEAEVDNQRMSALVGITNVIGNNYNNPNGPEFYGGSDNGRGTEQLGVRVVVTPENVVSPRDVYDNIGTGNGNYIVIRFDPGAIKAYDSLFVNASEQSPLPQEPEEPTNGGVDGGNGGLPTGITRDDFNSIYGEGGLIPLTQPYIAIEEEAMSGILSDAGISRETSDLVNYMINNNYERNGGPYDSTNGPQGDFVFDESPRDGNDYLVTRSDEPGLEHFILNVPDSDAQRIRNFIGVGRV